MRYGKTVTVPDDADERARQAADKFNQPIRKHNARVREFEAFKARIYKRREQIRCDHELLREVIYPDCEVNGVAIDGLKQLRCAYQPCNRLVEISA